MSSHRSVKSQKLKLIQLAKKAEDDKVSIGCSLSPRCMSRFSAFPYDSDEEDRSTSPTDVPEGYMAVYVGRKRKRFVIPTSYLSLPVFRTLLDRAEEEFGFDHKGGLTLPCDVQFFKQVLKILKGGDSAQQQMSMADILNVIAREEEAAARREALQHSTKSFRPLFRAAQQKSFG